MNSIEIRQFEKLVYKDLKKILRVLTPIETHVALSDMPEKVEHLRTNELKPYREMRDAALDVVA